MTDCKEMAIRQVEFDHDQIQVIERDGRHYVAMKPICVALGLTWRKQHRMITEDPVLSSVITIMVTTGSDGKQYDMVCLPLEYLNGWLFKIPASRYQGERREKIVCYQRECYLALYRHFFQGRHPGREDQAELSIKAKLALQAGLNPYARAVLERDFGVTPQWEIEAGERYMATDEGLMSIRPRPTAWRANRERQAEVVELYHRGLPKARIAERLRGAVSRSQVYRWLKMLDSETNNMLQEVLTDGRGPDGGICFSARGIDGLVYIAADIRMAVQHAERLT